ncbi:MAG: cell division protein FtsQ/DivIB [Pseudomonadota bacterium]
MWDNAQALRQLSNTLLGISLLLIFYGVLHYTVHLPLFALRAVQLSTAPQHVNTAQIEAVIRNELRGNFFTVDLDATRQAFEKLPWVRKVSVRRSYPWQLEVTLEEHAALARWNGSELVNTLGEVFAAETDQVLPSFFGQPDTAAEITQQYHAFSKQLAPLQQQALVQISLSPRRAWQLRLSNGMVLELGREQAQQRLARFVEVYPYSLAPLAHKVNYVDLRYRNGFAVNWPGANGRVDPPKGPRDKV